MKRRSNLKRESFESLICSIVLCNSSLSFSPNGMKDSIIIIQNEKENNNTLQPNIINTIAEGVWKYTHTKKAKINK